MRAKWHNFDKVQKKAAPSSEEKEGLIQWDYRMKYLRMKWYAVHCLHLCFSDAQIIFLLSLVENGI